MAQHSRGKLSVENGYSLENFCSSMLVCLHILPMGKAIIMGKDSRLSEKTQKLRNFSCLNVLPYTVPSYSTVQRQCHECPRVMVK